jgi:hypothetical protein
MCRVFRPGVRYAADGELGSSEKPFVALHVPRENGVRQARRLQATARLHLRVRLRGSRVERFRNNDREVHSRFGIVGPPVDAGVASVLDGDHVDEPVAVYVTQRNVGSVFVCLTKEVRLRKVGIRDVWKQRIPVQVGIRNNKLVAVIPRVCVCKTDGEDVGSL